MQAPITSRRFFRIKRLHLLEDIDYSEWLHPAITTIPFSLTLAVIPISSGRVSTATFPSCRVKKAFPRPLRNPFPGEPPVVAIPSARGKGSDGEKNLSAPFFQSPQVRLLSGCPDAEKGIGLEMGTKNRGMGHYRQIFSFPWRRQTWRLPLYGRSGSGKVQGNQWIPADPQSLHVVAEHPGALVRRQEAPLLPFRSFCRKYERKAVFAHERPMHRDRIFDQRIDLERIKHGDSTSVRKDILYHSCPK